MANCCILGRNRPLLISVGLIGGLFVVTFLLAWLVSQVLGLLVIAPAAVVSRRARVHCGHRVRALAVTLDVAREKLSGVFEAVAPRTRCRVSSALMRYNVGAAGFVYRHFVGLATALILLVGGASCALIHALVT